MLATRGGRAGCRPLPSRTRRGTTIVRAVSSGPAADGQRGIDPPGPLRPATPPRCTAPLPRIPKRAVTAPGSGAGGSDLEAGKALALVLFSAHVMGTASALAELPTPAWMAAVAGAAIGGVFAALSRWCQARLWRPPSTPLTAVVTGGTRGLGKALAREFLSHGDRVVITGTTREGVRRALVELSTELGLDQRLVVAPPAATLAAPSAAAPDAADAAASSALAVVGAGGGGGAAEHPPPRLYGMVCDVSVAADVAALAAQAGAQLGAVDVWLCNAGCSGSFAPFLEAGEGVFERVVGTNLLGTLLCAREAAAQMLCQPLGGHIFLMEGAGSDGFATPQYAAYGATKAALTQLASSLRAELRGTHVGVHLLSPGMMLTDLLLDNASPANKAVFNVLCEPPEVPAAFLTPRIRTVVAQGANGRAIRYLTPAAALGRFLTAPLRMGRFFNGQGEAVYLPEEERLLGQGAKATARRQAAARARTGGLGLAYGLSLAASMALMIIEQAQHYS